MEAPQVIIRQAQAEAAPHLLALLAPAIRHDPTIRDVREALTGANLYAIEHAGSDVAAFVLRQDGDECVIVAAGGSLPGVSLLGSILPHIERHCGARWVRIHSARRGMARQLARHGYGVAEIVYRKELNHHGR